MKPSAGLLERTSKMNAKARGGWQCGCVQRWEGRRLWQRLTKTVLMTLEIGVTTSARAESFSQTGNRARASRTTTAERDRESSWHFDSDFQFSNLITEVKTETDRRESSEVRL